MAEIVGPPATAVRNRAITAELRGVLNGAADANGIQRVVIFSGGQTDNHAPHLKNVVGGWTGSRRHDNGRAADIHLIRDGNMLSFTNSNGSQVAAFITDVAARGANGIGAATDYMGPTSIHVGFGLSPSDTTELTWGRNGASANAPMWLRTAARAGWNNPVGRSHPRRTRDRQSTRRTMVAQRARARFRSRETARGRNGADHPRLRWRMGTRRSGG